MREGAKKSERARVRDLDGEEEERERKREREGRRAPSLPVHLAV